MNLNPERDAMRTCFKQRLLPSDLFLPDALLENGIRCTTKTTKRNPIWDENVNDDRLCVSERRRRTEDGLALRFAR